MPPLDHLGIIAGNGIYPQILAKAARLAGVEKISAVAFANETDPKLVELVDQIDWLRVGELNRFLSLFREWSVGQAIMAGQIAPRNLFDLRPDWRALLLLAKLKRRNAESIFSAIALELEKIGVTLLPASTFLDQFLAPNGVIVGPKLSRREKSDVEFGWDIAKQIASLDIGQTIVVKNGTVLAVEGLDGTNETIRRGGAIGGSGVVVIKISKPNQDLRFDIPVIGMETIGVATEAQVRVIAVEAGQTLLLERDRVREAASVASISIVGR